MAFIHGKGAAVKVASTDISAFTNSIEWDHEAETHETTTYGKTYKTYFPGLKGAKVSLSGIYDTTATTGLQAVLSPLLGTSTTFEFGPEGSASGKVKYSGAAVLASFNISAPVGDMVQWDADLQVSDTVTVGTYP